MSTTISPDARLEDADWTKTGWDFPPYRSAEFMLAVPDLDAFRRLPAYAFAVRGGLIHDDEWVGDWAQPRGPRPARHVHVHLPRRPA